MDAYAFGQMVKDLRTNKGMTQEELAEATGLTRTTVSNIERGYGNCKIDSILAIGTVLEADLTFAVPDNKKTEKEKKIDEMAYLMMSLDISEIDSFLTLTRSIVNRK